MLDSKLDLQTDWIRGEATFYWFDLQPLKCPVPCLQDQNFAEYPILQVTEQCHTQAYFFEDF